MAGFYRGEKKLSTGYDVEKYYNFGIRHNSL